MGPMLARSDTRLRPLNPLASTLETLARLPWDTKTVGVPMHRDQGPTEDQLQQTNQLRLTVESRDSQAGYDPAPGIAIGKARVETHQNHG